MKTVLNFKMKPRGDLAYKPTVRLAAGINQPRTGRVTVELCCSDLVDWVCNNIASCK